MTRMTAASLQPDGRDDDIVVASEVPSVAVA
jgi:hypothetical protein